MMKNKRRVYEEIDDAFKTHLAGTTYLLESPWFLFLQHLQNLTVNASKDSELQSLNDSNFKTLRDDYKSFFFNKVKVFEIASYQKRKNKLPSKQWVGHFVARPPRKYSSNCILHLNYSYCVLNKKKLHLQRVKRRTSWDSRRMDIFKQFNKCQRLHLQKQRW